MISTNCGTVKPCASIIASVQPSGEAASNSKRAAAVGLGAVATTAGGGHGGTAGGVGGGAKRSGGRGPFEGGEGCPRPRDRKVRSGRRARRCAAAITKRASAVSSAKASMADCRTCCGGRKQDKRAGGS